MSSLQIEEKNYSLLLNLLLRETNNWYFFNIVPKYDNQLADFMLKVSSKGGYIRYDLSEDKTVFIPLCYRSLTGMHVAGSKIAIRNVNYGSLSVVNYKDILPIIVQDVFKIDKNRFDSLFTRITKIYAEYQQHSFQNFTSKDLIKNLSLDTIDNNVKVIVNGVLSREIFGEYQTVEDLKSLYEIINSFAEKSKDTKVSASVKWVKSYINALLKDVVELFSEKGVLVNPSFYNTTVFFNEDMLPFEIEFSKETPSVLVDELINVDLSRLKENLKSQLLNHHIYPLIRCVGVLGLADEKILLDTVTEVLCKFRDETKNSLDFFENTHTKVTSFLPLIFKTKTDFSLKQVHIHNHIHNRKYYSNALIKPNPGEVVHKRYFNEGAMEIAIRGFDINTDLEVLHEWVNLEYAKKFWEMDGPIEDLEQEYIKHLGVDYSHPYIGTLNGEPIFTLELYWAVKDIVGKYYPFHPGDYGFHMLIAPAKKRIPNFSYYALTMCMEHFFSHSQVNRMIGEASAEHMGTHNLITKVGCEFDKALVLPYKTSNLTFLTREMYKKAVRDVFENKIK